MVIRKHPDQPTARRLCGLCVPDHKHHNRTSIHRQKTSKIQQDHVQGSQTQKRQQETKTHPQQDRLRLATILRQQRSTEPRPTGAGRRQLH